MIPPEQTIENFSPESSLEGQLLIAMPGMPDERFENAVIYVCAHSQDGAMGITINMKARELAFSDLVDKLDIMTEEQAEINLQLEEMDVLIGGPVEQQRGFVLHTPDYKLDENTLPIKDEICLTATLDIVCAIAEGEGPKKSLLALGYAGWAPGQLENELKYNGWLNCPATSELVFGTPVEKKYSHALSSMGISEAHLSQMGGSA